MVILLLTFGKYESSPSAYGFEMQCAAVRISRGSNTVAVQVPVFVSGLSYAMCNFTTNGNLPSSTSSPSRAAAGLASASPNATSESLVRTARITGRQRDDLYSFVL